MHSIAHTRPRRTHLNCQRSHFPDARPRWNAAPVSVRKIARRAQCSLSHALVIAELLSADGAQ